MTVLQVMADSLKKLYFELPNIPDWSKMVIICLFIIGNCYFVFLPMSYGIKEYLKEKFKK